MTKPTGPSLQCPLQKTASLSPLENHSGARLLPMHSTTSCQGGIPKHVAVGSNGRFIHKTPMASTTGIVYPTVVSFSSPLVLHDIRATTLMFNGRRRCGT